MQCGNLPTTATVRLPLIKERGDESVQIWPKMGIGQKLPALTGLRKTDAVNPMKPFKASRNQRFRKFWSLLLRMPEAGSFAIRVALAVFRLWLSAGGGMAPDEGLGGQALDLTPPVSSSDDRRYPPDWECKVCQRQLRRSINFARRTECYRCGIPRSFAESSTFTL